MEDGVTKLVEDSQIHCLACRCVLLDDDNDVGREREWRTMKDPEGLVEDDSALADKIPDLFVCSPTRQDDRGCLVYQRRTGVT